jgi:voltage-gated potassium channel Kch
MFRPEFIARIRYEFDKTMAAGPIALIGWLGLISLAIITVAASVVSIFGIVPEGDEDISFIESLWASLMRAMDSGTVAGDAGWGFRIIMLLVTLAGIFIVSALIGVLNTGLDGKLEELSKGKSKVLEKDHTIIFNWSESIYDVIREIVIANESRRKPRIVIMANMDKLAMEEDIADKIKDLKNTRVICRSGDPTVLFDIRLVSPETCRSVIIMSPENGDADAQVIKTILALVNDSDRSPDTFQIAAELRDADNVDLARVVGGDEVQIVLADDLIARVMVQSTREPGLSAVFVELLGFDGCEIYVVEQPELAGKTFGEAVMAYDTSSLIGVCSADGVVSLNPPSSLPITLQMSMVLIAEDDSTIRLDGKATNVAISSDGKGTAAPPKPEQTLILGWNRRAPIIASELSRYVGPGSLLTIAADVPDIEQAVADIIVDSGDLKIELKKVNTGRWADISSLDPLSYDHILVLAHNDHMSAQAADTRTLVSLLHLRKMKEPGNRSISIVSEIVDVRNRTLASVTNINDFVVSNKLVGLMLAQASENEHLEAIFKDLLDDGGSEISMRPAENYVTLGQDTTYQEAVQAALARGEVAIGHHIMNQTGADGVGQSGIIINPIKSTAFRYNAEDRIIVLAE